MAIFHTERKSDVTKSRETPYAGRRPTTLPTWVPHSLCDTMSRTAPTVPPTKLQKPPHLLRPTCGFNGVPTASPLHRPPVSRATTTDLHWLVVSLFLRAWAKVAPSTSPASGWGSPEHPNALRSVTPTAGCGPPKRWKILGQHFDSSIIGCRHSHVHISQKRVEPNTSACFAKHRAATCVPQVWPVSSASLTWCKRLGGDREDQMVRNTRFAWLS